MEAGRSGEDRPGSRMPATVGNEHRVSGSGCVVDQTGAIGRPIELGRAFEVGFRLSPESGHPPDAYAAARGVGLFAVPIRDEGAIGREDRSAELGNEDIGRAASSQVVKLSRTYLRNPDVHRSILVGQKRHEMTIVRDSGRWGDTVEVRDYLN